MATPQRKDDEEELSEDYASSTVLVDVLGESPKVRILSALLGSHNEDLNMSDIARFSGVHRSTVHRNIQDLLDYGLIEQSRQIGNSKMYRINKESEAAKKLAAFEWELLDDAE